MKTRIALTLSLGLILGALSAHAYADPTAGYSEQDRIKYFTIESAQVYDLTDQYPASEFSPTSFAIEPNAAASVGERVAAGATFAEGVSPVGLGDISRGVDQVDLIVDKIINIGKKIWDVVERGRPVATFENAGANALPENATRMEQLQNWQTPKTKVVGVIYKNYLGIEVVKFTYRVMLLYGGDVNGVGKYIGHAAVQPMEMTVAWGYTFNAKATVDSVFNKGTHQAPVAGMIMNIKWTVETVLKKSTITHTFNLDGNGTLNAPDDHGGTLR